MFARAEIRNKKRRISVNSAPAVRISGDGGQEGRHLANNKKGYGTRYHGILCPGMVAGIDDRKTDELVVRESAHACSYDSDLFSY